MDDFVKAPLWQKILLVFIVFTGLFWFSYNYLFKEPLREVKELTIKLVHIDLELMSMLGPRVEVKKGEEMKANLEKELRGMVQTIPTEAEIPFLLNQFVTQVGKGLNVEYTAIEPRGVVPRKGYAVLPIQVSFTSEFPGVTAYINQLNSLPTTIKIDNLVINRLDGNPPRLDVGMNLSAFVISGKPEKDIKVSAKSPQFHSDPFLEKDTASVETDLAKGVSLAGDFVLQGFWKGNKIKAFINDQIVGVGDSIEGYKVIKISGNQVKLKKGKDTITLTLGGE
jgi:Tfp pilus assembly protein PilO